eukprot:6185858-Pleurochrysis_carterae.AAC.2
MNRQQFALVLLANPLRPARGAHGLPSRGGAGPRPPRPHSSRQRHAPAVGLGASPSGALSQAAGQARQMSRRTLRAVFMLSRRTLRAVFMLSRRTLRAVFMLSRRTVRAVFMLSRRTLRAVFMLSRRTHADARGHRELHATGM